MKMPLNIEIHKDNLIHLASLDAEDWRVTMMPVENISENNTLPEESYLFSIKTGSILFRSINGKYQISSCTDDTPKRTIIAFAKICEDNDVNYVALGFEPNF